MASKERADQNLESCCWQCTEFCVYFPEVMNAINDINKNNNVATKQAIEEKIQSFKDGFEKDKSMTLGSILKYASEQGYIIKEHKKGRKRRSSLVSYYINHNIVPNICSSCNESIQQFNFSNLVVKNDYVDRGTFKNLAKEVAELKKIVNGKHQGNEQDIDILIKENAHLKEELLSKEKYIENLLDKFVEIKFAEEAKHVNTNKTSKHVTFKVPEHSDSDDYTNFNNKNIRYKKSKHQNTVVKSSRSVDKGIPLQNRFSLWESDDDLTSPQDNEDSDKDDTNVTFRRKLPLQNDVRKRPDNNNVLNNRNNINNYMPNTNRPTIVTNKHPENDIESNRTMRIVPGVHNYSKMVRKKRKIAIVGDSMISKLKFFEENRNSNDTTIIKRTYLGGVVEDIEYYLHKILEKKDMDTVVLHIGTNNLTSKETTIKQADEIANEILRAVSTCEKFGVKNIYVSGITDRPGYSQQIKEINKYLQNSTKSMNYTFIHNSNLRKEEHLFDRVHLNDTGLEIFKRNILGAVGVAI